MEIFLLVVVGVLVLVGALLLQRRRRPPSPQPLASPQQASASEEPADADLAQGQEASLSPWASQDHAKTERPQPLAPQQRRKMLRYLESAYNKGAEARLAAMEDMVAWGHPSCLPLLRRGLRDADLRVVGLAARGLERFRGPRQRLRNRSSRPLRPRGTRPSPPA